MPGVFPCLRPGGLARRPPRRDPRDRPLRAAQGHERAGQDRKRGTCLGTLRQRAEFIELLGSAYRGTGDNKKAMLLAEELLALGKANQNKVIIAKGLLSKAYTSFANNELATSHQLAWESETWANQTDDMPTRIRATISSGESYAEDGNFPPALKKLQLAVKMAHEYGHPIQIVAALNSLASLYGQMKEYDKGFEALAEAYPYAEKTNSPGRMSTLKDTEYGLSVATNQPQRRACCCWPRP
ncbi:hypothetical protein LP420_27755 [Massilia sp. B-10]|nr:hypothetical protein LP420_27755 [Massilia sp. B-10]